MKKTAIILVLALAVSLLALAGDHPWKNAKVGDWVKYESVTMGNTTQMKWTVTAKTEKSLTYEVETTVAGQTFKTSSTVDLTAELGPAGVAMPKDAPKPVVTDDTVTVAGKSWKCKKVEMTLANGMKTVSVLPGARWAISPVTPGVLSSTSSRNSYASGPTARSPVLVIFPMTAARSPGTGRDGITSI